MALDDRSQPVPIAADRLADVRRRFAAALDAEIGGGNETARVVRDRWSSDP